MGPAFLGPRDNDDVILAESYGQALLNWSTKIENMHQVKETKTTLKPLYSKCKVSQMNPHYAVYYRRLFARGPRVFHSGLRWFYSGTVNQGRN